MNQSPSIIDRRRLLRGAGAGLTAAVLGSAAWPVRAQGFSGRPVRLLVGFAAGGTNDLIAREIAPKFGEMLGTSVVVDNRPGANGVVAASAVARAQPDGTTLLFTYAGTFAQNPHTMLSQPYDVFRDFTPIGLVAVGPSVLVGWTGLPVRDVRELVAFAKANPGKLSISSSGTGTSTHIYAEILMREAGIQLLHVPYKGAGDAARDLMAGTVQLTFTGAATGVQFVNSGRARLLGITQAQRSPLFPELPTMAEQGVAGLDLPGWQGIFGPPNLPPQLLDQLNGALTRALADAGTRAQVGKLLWEARPSAPAELGRIVRSDYERWGKMIRDLGIKPQ